jgi:hypothetical protein
MKAKTTPLTPLMMALGIGMRGVFHARTSYSQIGGSFAKNQRQKRKQQRRVGKRR